MSVPTFHFLETTHILPLFCCICISLQVTPSNLFTCLLFSLLPSWRVSVTNFRIMSNQPESAWSVEALASETIMSHKVKFSKRWSTLFEGVIQHLLLRRKGGKKRKKKTKNTLFNILYFSRNYTTWRRKIKYWNFKANTLLKRVFIFEFYTPFR